jgi:hypothetical protein
MSETKIHTYESITTHKGRKSRRFYDDKKRKVLVDVMKFWGMGNHFWVKIQEDDNLIWLASKKAWVSYPDDSLGKGKLFEKKFNTKEEAQIFIDTIIRENFPDATHMVQHNEGGESYNWYYGEGD